MPVDKRRLKKHKANKERLKRLEEKIQDLCSTEAEEVMGKVRGSSKYFPYTEVRTSVVMADPYEQEKIDKQIRKAEAERMLLKTEVDEVDEYIEAIGDPEIKEIFEYLYQEGRSQSATGEKLGYSQGRISQIVAEYLKD
nr:sigma factor-like helix-turn-helix DNA-binding protein [uncultured Faecalimonas sp.]